LRGTIALEAWIGLILLCVNRSLGLWRLLLVSAERAFTRFFGQTISEAAFFALNHALPPFKSWTYKADFVLTMDGFTVIPFPGYDKEWR
jgi:hypothetical protein